MLFPFIFLLFITTLTFCLLPKQTLITLIRRNKISKKKTAKNPPGPPGLPFIGNFLQFDKAKPHIYLYHLAKKYGPLAFLKHGHTPILVVSSPRMAKLVLKTHDLAFCSRPPVLGQQKLAYDGIDMAFSPYNQHYKEMRKVCVLHLFSPKQVHYFRPVREDEICRMIAKVSGLVNLSDVAMSLASNLICRVAFGRRYDEDEFEKMRFDRLVIEAQALMVSFYFSDHFPAVGWLDKVSTVGQTPQKPAGRQDIIDLMIQLKDQNASSLDLSWDHIKALLMVNLAQQEFLSNRYGFSFLFPKFWRILESLVAGTDTVAAAVVWAMTGLMLNPAVMKKAQTEIRQFIGEKGQVDEDDIRNLPYLKAVVLETLRLYPPAPLLFRTQILDEDCVLDGYKIKPGTSVIINGWAIGRDPETWQDPEEFQPERFMTSNGGVVDVSAKTGEFEMIPFGGGEGVAGMEWGLISAELALANLLYSFDWALPAAAPGSNVIDTDALPGLTTHKKNPLLLVATKPTHNILCD
ncbi:UNVERIFIED_CONTAM: cytochrome [Sesamum calycinum]|uniref:Cytochrome n=1 Tax=Sesamum calycinum TaxID=2727403 RepID=A0AAW2IT20_9LAMI